MSPASRARSRPPHARADAARRGRRHARRPLPQRRRALRAGAHDAPARRPLQPRLRRHLHGRPHARGGFIGPGEEFTYRWEATPDSVGAWPYHDHGPNHTLNTFRGLFGAIIIYPKGEKRPTSSASCSCTAAAARDRPGPPVPGDQRPRLRRQHADGRAKVGQDVAFHVRDGRQLPHVPHPRPPLADSSGQFVDSRRSAPTRPSPPASPKTTRAAGSTTARSSRIRTGWRLVRRHALDVEEARCAVPPRVCAATAELAAVPQAAAAQTPSYPPPSNPGSVQKKPNGPFRTLTVGKDQRYRTIQSRSTPPAPATASRSAPARTASPCASAARASASSRSSATSRTRSASCSRARAAAQNGVTVNGADNVTMRRPEGPAATRPTASSS